MRTESDHRFYLRRAAQERLMAIRAITPQARSRHEALAARFARRAEQAQAVSI
ncbi:hypothetical protein [Sphingomicrobium lutaoense]|uniref:Uncharacterized protein n=1 Tax=Sphingomicrobium lutaoense TaxID=515949 RepID=A0A839YW71_9SPHN|nr:hypothetical protein [Sphingomicrobium lutaoense]MBB3763276.1 hypothetical protein [Sphingomicrobium lutaoense]